MTCKFFIGVTFEHYRVLSYFKADELAQEIYEALKNQTKEPCPAVLAHSAPLGAVPVDAYFWFAQDFIGLLLGIQLGWEREMAWSLGSSCKQDSGW